MQAEPNASGFLPDSVERVRYVRRMRRVCRQSMRNRAGPCS
ncbi:hypothetical protein HMPREF1155_1261 [Slackia sp. CM382]|nr:hypothetical protein HMPREF1155_1261 [Slackia sp. CM382]